MSASGLLATVGISAVLAAAGLGADATPAAGNGPIVITQGGTYSGSWESTSSSTPAVQILTTEPVTIVSSTVRNLAGGRLIEIPNGAQANVTIDRVFAFGGSGRFVYAEGFKSITVSNCTIDQTAGIDLRSPVASSSVSVTRNRMRNVQQPSEGELRQFLQLNRVTTASVDISWNEVVNTFGQSRVEDNISVYMSSNARIHDNFIHGGYPAGVSSSYRGSGIAIGDGGGNYNQVYDNQVVATTNVGIGIAGGHDNFITNNRVVSDGRLDNGTMLSAANVGISVWNWSNDPTWGNNHATGNTVGWINQAGSRNDLWFAHAPNETSKNTRARHRISRSVEVAEYERWLVKLVAAGFRVGA